MLGKVLKNEWKSTYKVGCLMLILLAGITFLGWLAFRSPMWWELSNDNFYYGETFGMSILNLVSVFTLLFYFIMLVVVPVGIVIYLGVHFYRTMYTDEGYLTHTLPVTEGRLLFAKTLISGVWVLIISLGVILSVFAILLFMVDAMLPAGYSLGEFFREFQEVYDAEFAEMVSMLETVFGMDFNGYMIYTVITLLLGSFTSVMTLFGAISLGQLFTRHRVLMAIVSYIGIQIASGILNSVLQGIVTGIFINNASESATVVGGYINASMIISEVLSVILAGLLYLASWLVNIKRLNLE